MSELTDRLFQGVVAAFFVSWSVLAVFDACAKPSPVGPGPLPLPAVEAPLPSADSTLAAVLAERVGDSTFLPTDTLLEIAQALRETSELEGVDPTLLARLIAVESDAKPWALGPPIQVRVRGRLVRTRAVGLGQIVPELWLGVYPECGPDLTTIHTNICYTALIWRHYRDSHPTRRLALLAYNGCRGSHCQWYAPAILDP